MQYLRQATGSQAVLIGPFVDSTDGVTAETGLTIANTDIRLSANGGNMAAKNSGGGTHDENGWYTITLDATDTATVGRLQVSCVVSGALPVFSEFQVLEENVYDMLFAASADLGTTVDTIASDLVIVASDVVVMDGRQQDIYSDTAQIVSDLALVYSDTGAINADTVVIKSDLNKIQGSDLVNIYSDTAVIANVYSDTTIITSDTAAIEAAGGSLTTAQNSKLTQIHSDLIIVGSDVVQVYSDTTIIASDTAAIESAGGSLTVAQDSKLTQVHSDLIVVGSDVLQVYSDTTIIYSDTTAIEAAGGSLTTAQNSKLTQIHSDLIVTGSDVLQIYSDTTVIASDLVQVYSDTTQIAQAVIGVASAVDDVSASTTEFDTDLTAADDFYNDQILLFTSGSLAGQSKPILDYENAGGHITLDEALTAAPGNNDTFVIIPHHVHPIAQITSGVWAGLLTENQTANSFGSAVQVIASDVLQVYSDTTIIASDLVQVYSDTAAIHTVATTAASDLVIVQSDLLQVYSDTTIIVSDTTAIHTVVTTAASDLVIVQSDLLQVYSDTTVIASDLVIVASDAALLEGAGSLPGQVAPSATASPLTQLATLYKAWRNRSTQTTSAYTLYADDATTVDQKATVSDDGTTFDRGEVGSGP